MKATVPYIEKKFQEFNRQMFDGKLPMPPIEVSDAKTYLGLCVSQQRRLPNGRIGHYNFRLRFNARIDLSERELEDIIIHEMIHYYIGINKLEDSSAHGLLFRQIMNAINEKHGRKLTISHKSTLEQKEQLYDKRRRWHVVAVVSLKDGKTGVKVLPRVAPKILHYYNAMSNSDRITGIQLYLTNDIFFNRFPNSAALAVTYVDKDELMRNLESAGEIGCDGKSFTIGNRTYGGAERQEPSDSHRVGRLCIVAVLKLKADKRIGIKVLPRTRETILRYYNEIKKFEEVLSINLYLSSNAYFERFPRSGKLTYYYEDESRVMNHLEEIGHLNCDGKSLTMID